MPDLPEDIIAIICDNSRFGGTIVSSPQTCLRQQPVPPDNAYLHMFYNLSLLNHAWNRVAERFLYSDLYIGGSSRCQLPAKKLVASFARNPWKARLVRTLRVRIDTGIDSAADYSESKSVVATIGASHQVKQYLLDGLQHGAPDAASALLICLCANVRQLNVWDLGSIEDSIVLQVIRQSICDNLSSSRAHLQSIGTSSTLDVLKFLQFVKAGWRQDNFKMSAANKAELAIMGSAIWNPVPDSEWPVAFSNNLLNVRGSCVADIKVGDVALSFWFRDMHDFETMMASFPDARELCLRSDASRIAMYFMSSFDGDVIVKTICRYGSKLKSLTINEDMHMLWLSTPKYGFWPAMSSLEVLSVAYSDFLYATDESKTGSASLRKLTFNTRYEKGWNNGEFPDMAIFDAMTGGDFPRLVEVEIIAPDARTRNSEFWRCVHASSWTEISWGQNYSHLVKLA